MSECVVRKLVPKYILETMWLLCTFACECVYASLLIGYSSAACVWVYLCEWKYAKGLCTGCLCKDIGVFNALFTQSHLKCMSDSLATPL